MGLFSMLCGALDMDDSTLSTTADGIGLDPINPASGLQMVDSCGTGFDIAGNAFGTNGMSDCGMAVSFDTFGGGF